jgi:hypothetical protein
MQLKKSECYAIKSGLRNIYKGYRPICYLFWGVVIVVFVGSIVRVLDLAILAA